MNIKTDKEIEYMRYAGRVAKGVLDSLKSFIKIGITTNQIDKYVYDYIISKDCYPTCLGFDGFPKSICASVNEEVVHGIPDDRKLKDGDIITIDIGVTYKNMIVDTAYTYKVGNVSKEIENLLENTERALYDSIKVIKKGIKLNEVCKRIEKVALKNNYGVIRELTGHGVGHDFHEDPFIPNYSNSESERIILESGMTLAIEPMFSLKKREVWMLQNGWTISTQDKSPAAHFEHTILVTNEGYEILTGESE